MTEIAEAETPLGWFIVEAYEKEIESAYLRLARAEYEVWAPIDRVRRPDRREKAKAQIGAFKNRRRRDARSFRFGRYFFVKCRLTPSVWHAITNTTSVLGIVSKIPVPEEQIQFQRENLPSFRKTEVVFSKKDHVVIKDGPFATFPGIVTDVDNRGILRVDVSIFGRSTPIVIEVGHVSMVVQAKSLTKKTFQGTGAQNPKARSSAAA